MNITGSAGGILKGIISGAFYETEPFTYIDTKSGTNVGRISFDASKAWTGENKIKKHILQK